MAGPESNAGSRRRKNACTGESDPAHVTVPHEVDAEAVTLLWGAFLQYARRTRRCYALGVNSAKGTCVFLVRMWLHGGEPEAGGTWRGSIQDVESGRIFYLADTRDVAEFIDARLSERAKSGLESRGDSE